MTITITSRLTATEIKNACAHKPANEIAQILAENAFFFNESNNIFAAKVLPDTLKKATVKKGVTTYPTELIFIKVND